MEGTTGIPSLSMSILLTATLSPTNTNIASISDEFFHVLANFDRPIVVTLKGVYKQVKLKEFF